MKYMFSAKIWFMKTSTRIVKHESQVIKSNPDGLHDHLRDVPWENIFKLSLLLLLVNFLSGFRLELMYISLIISIRSNLAHLHGFQQLVLLPEFIEITFFFFVPTEKIF